MAEVNAQTEKSCTPLAKPIAILPQYIAESTSTIVVKQKEYTSCGRDYVIQREDQSVLFVVKAKSSSRTQRRCFEDASGQPLFDLRRRLFSKACHWYLDRPGEDRRALMTANLRFSMNLGLKLTVRNAAGPGADGVSDVKVDVLEMGSHGVKTLVLAGAEELATITRTASDGRPSESLAERASFKKRPIWTVRAAQGMDLALAAVIAVMCAEHYPEYHFAIS